MGFNQRPRVFAGSLILALSILSASPLSSKADELERTASRGCFVESSTPSSCYCVENQFAVGTYDAAIGYLLFPISSLIPQGSTINSATLSLWCTIDQNAGTLMVGRCENDPWDEGTSCPTWNDRPGFELPPQPSTVEINGNNKWYYIDVTAIAEQWFTYGVSHRGFYLEMSSGHALFASDDYTVDPAKYPKITINYTLGPCPAGGRVTDALGNGVHNVNMHFTRISGSGTTPTDVSSDVQGYWSQSDFKSTATYRVTPSKSECGAWTFSPTSRDFDCESGDRMSLDFVATPPTVGIPTGVTAIPGPEMGEITLSWNHVCGALTYVIRYDDDLIDPWDPLPDGNPGSGEDIGYVNSVIISGLGQGKQYRLVVAAANTQGLGAYSPQVIQNPRAPVIVGLHPPFAGATYSNDVTEFEHIGDASVGAVPSDLDPTSGGIHQRSGIVLMGVAGTVFQSKDAVSFDIVVPNSGEYKITIRGHVSGGILAAGHEMVYLPLIGLVGIYDIKHAVWIIGTVENGGTDVFEVWNTLPEGLTSGIRELSAAGAEALFNVYCTGVTGGVCGVADLVLTVNEIYDVWQTVTDFATALAGFDEDVTLEVVADLEGGVPSSLELYSLCVAAGGVSGAYAASFTDVTFIADSVIVEQQTGSIGPVMSVSPSGQALLPATTVGTVTDYPSVFTISNLGDQALIGQVSISTGPFALTSPLNYNIPPGGSAVVDVKFSPGKDTTYTATVQFSGGQGANRTLRCTAIDPAPSIAIYPDSARFDSVDVGQQITFSAFSVTNTGGGTLVGTVSVAPPFSVSGDGSYSLTHGQTKVIDLTFSPSMEGMFVSTVSFTGADGASRVAQGYAEDNTSDVREVGAGQVPREYSLSQNYPNPFNAGTQIQFSHPADEHVTLMIYDVLGREVARLADLHLSAGVWSVNWDGTDANDQILGSGVYFYRIIAGRYEQTRKMVILK